MALIHQQHEEMRAAGANYNGLGTGVHTDAGDQLNLALRLSPENAWCDPVAQQMLSNVEVQTRQSIAHGDNLVAQANAINGSADDGEMCVADSMNIALTTLF